MASRCPFWPQQCLGCHPAPKPAFSIFNGLPAWLSGNPTYALFSFFWFLPVRPADVACWTTPDGAWVSKNIGAFFLSPPPIAPRAGGHQSDCVPSLPAYSGSECLTRAVAIGSLLRVASLLRALLSSPVKWESRILRAETHLTACGAEGDVGRGPGGHLGQRAARPPFGDLL